jgi:CRP/FNR family transcriptional regulator, cyclic AMP receptor protein
VDLDALTTLTAEQRDLLLAVAATRTFRRRETLFHAGDPGDAIFLIRSGHVAIRVDTEHGDNATLAVLGPGDSFGELALLSPEGRRSATATALEETVVWTLSRAQLTGPQASRLASEALLVQLLSNQVHRLTSQLVDALYVPVRHRVARVLLDLCSQYDEGASRVTMLVTQDDIAGLTGAGRPTVNQVLRALESAGAIELRRGRIDVVDRAVLARHRG